ncbi:MAG TPA: hypothetical protein PL124_04545 [Candidatus Cloacimonadota bacterium]|nr:hypothetical protein [Candidatus Cloacimonadota bacterium]HPS38662.1 hypothetical protein [Candidatus Cloacimonadota bacterium]
MRVLLVLMIAVIFLGGCVAMDISSMNTAEPLGTNRVRFGYNTGMGASMNYVADWQNFVQNNEEDDLTFPGEMISSFEGAIGVTDHSDLGAKAWAGLGSAGVKILYKNSFPQTSPGTYSAIIPSLAYANTNVGYENDDGEDLFDHYSVVGPECQFLLTKKASQYFSMTLAGQAGAYLYNVDEDSEKSIQTSLIYRVGLGANLKIDVKPMYLMLEAGGEMMQSDTGGVSFLPYAMVGLGLN